MTVEDLNNILDDLSRGFRPSAKDKERKYARCFASDLRSITLTLLQNSDREFLPYHQREVYPK